MGRECSTDSSDERCLQKFGQKTEGKRPLVRSRSRCEDNIRVDVRKIRGECVDWIHLTKGAVASYCEHGNEPSASIKDGEFLD
jgi:hypothetical protein